MVSRRRGEFARHWKEIAAAFLKLGFTAYGGFAAWGIMQAELQEKRQWVLKERFVEGLSLVNMMPGATATGPILMVSAYIGYKLAGIAGAATAATATFLPSFIVMLSLLPSFEWVRTLVWTTAAMKGVGAAVIGVLAVSLAQMAPHTLPDPIAIVILIATLTALLAWRIGAIKLMMAGAGLGVVRSRLCTLLGVWGTLRQICSNVTG